MCGVGEQGLLPEGVEPGTGAPAQVHLHLQHHHQASAPSPQAGKQLSLVRLDPTSSATILKKKNSSTETNVQ